MSLPELLAQRAELDRQIAAEKAARFDEVVEHIINVIDDAGMPLDEIASALITRANKRIRKAKSAAKVSKAPAKYRHTDGPETWTGRGVKPAWFRNGNYAEI